MILTLLPQVGLPGQTETLLSVDADTLTVDGQPFDLSSVPEGGEGWPQGDHAFVGRITRAEGVIRCLVRVILGDDAAPDQPIDPDHWTVSCAQGPVPIPALRNPEVSA